MTYNELVYNIKELLRDHTDDSLIDPRHILFTFGTIRAKFLRQLYGDRAKKYDYSALQTLCLEMAPASKGTCCVKVDCTILRSKEKLPALLSIKGRSALHYVGPPLIGADKFDVVESPYVDSCLVDPYAGHVAFVEDNYLYVANTTPATKLIKLVRVVGLFENPIDLDTYSTCNGEELVPCNDSGEQDYPVPAHMISDINNEVLKLYVGTTQLEDKRDTTNNSVPE